MLAICLNSALSPVVYGDIALSINNNNRHIIPTDGHLDFNYKVTNHNKVLHSDINTLFAALIRV